MHPQRSAQTLKKTHSMMIYLSSVLNNIRKGDIIILMGDFNAQIGSDNTGYRRVMGKHGVGMRTDNGDRLRLTAECARSQAIIWGENGR